MQIRHGFTLIHAAGRELRAEGRIDEVKVKSLSADFLTQRHDSR